MTRILLILVLGCLCCVGAPPSLARGAPVLPSPGRPPLAGSPTVVRGFDPPAERWQSGHRGVDLLGTPGAAVVAAAAGTVTYAQNLAGRGVMVVDHGSVRTTYEPVTAIVPVGRHVNAGDTIGVLEPGHTCGTGDICLHWGLREGDTYLNPMQLITGSSRIRLLPADAAEGIARRAEERAQAAPSGIAGAVADGGPVPPPGSSGFTRPAAGAITSRFGMRLHPITKIWKLHDGTDFGTGCGAPLRAAANGVVTQSYFNAGYGNRLLIDHGTVGGRRAVTSYNHAIRYTVGPGQQVTAGQVIGVSGTTGYSTGCHLHFQMWIDGALVNPERWL